MFHSEIFHIQAFQAALKQMLQGAEDEISELTKLFHVYICKSSSYPTLITGN